MDLSKSSSRQRETFKEYRQQVRKRGAQFIQALQQKLPGVKVLTLFQPSYFAEFLDEPDSAERMRKLQQIFVCIP